MCTAGVHPAGGAGAPAAASAAAVRHDGVGDGVRGGRRGEGGDLLRGAVPGSGGERVPQAQHHRARRGPVPAGERRRRPAAVDLLQRGLLQLLRGRAGGAHRARLGADALRDGRRVRGLRGRHGRRPRQPRRRRRLLPQQAAAGQHLHSHSQGTCTYGRTTYLLAMYKATSIAL